MAKPTFALIGAAGYIAPRHMEAIRAVGGDLVVAHDIRDSVGVLDRYFPSVPFFTKWDEFEQLLTARKREGRPVDYVSICSPNDRHATQIEAAFRLGANAICEKPIVLSSQELERLQRLETETGRRVFTLLQLRIHDAVLQLRAKVAAELNAKPSHRYKIQLHYVTSRGPWYHQSWKGDPERSGGLVSNIGVHFFDLLTWVFGDAVEVAMRERSASRESGFLKLQKADVDWKLSIDSHDLPDAAKQAGKTTFRSLTIDGSEFEFSEGFTELHQKVYAEILGGRGFGLDDAAPAIRLVERVRSTKV